MQDPYKDATLVDELARGQVRRVSARSILTSTESGAPIPSRERSVWAWDEISTSADLEALCAFRASVG